MKHYRRMEARRSESRTATVLQPGRYQSVHGGRFEACDSWFPAEVKEIAVLSGTPRNVPSWDLKSVQCGFESHRPY